MPRGLRAANELTPRAAEVADALTELSQPAGREVSTEATVKALMREVEAE